MYIMFIMFITSIYEILSGKYITNTLSKILRNILNMTYALNASVLFCTFLSRVTMLLEDVRQQNQKTFRTDQNIAGKPAGGHG